MAPLQRDTGGGELSNRFPLPDGLSSEAMVGLYRSMYVVIVFGFRAVFTSIYALAFARRG